MNSNRRRFLKSATATIALPFLESAGFTRFASAAAIAAPPKRMMFLGMGFGVTSHAWFPGLDDTGYDYKIPESLSPLAGHKKDFSILQHLFDMLLDIS